jgi:tetratricopeptide (TPR) repeat protein
MNALLRSIALTTFLSLSTGALAQAKEDRPQAELALKEGVKAYKEAHYEEALASYLRAAQLAPSASGPYREMGKTYEALGRQEEAKSAYQEYLRRKPDADDANEIKGRLKVLGAPVASETAALIPIPTEAMSPAENKPKKRSTWVWVAGSAALVGLGVGTAVAIDSAATNNGGDDSGKGRGRGGKDNKRSQTPLLFTFGF